MINIVTQIIFVESFESLCLGRKNVRLWFQQRNSLFFKNWEGINVARNPKNSIFFLIETDFLFDSINFRLIKSDI